MKYIKLYFFCLQLSAVMARVIKHKRNCLSLEQNTNAFCRICIANTAGKVIWVYNIESRTVPKSKNNNDDIIQNADYSRSSLSQFLSNIYFIKKINNSRSAT